MSPGSSPLHFSPLHFSPLHNAIRSVARLRQVVAVAQHGSYSRAAVALNISQSALSRSVQTLEAGLGQRLFERTPTGVVPTVPGAVFVRQSIALLNAVDELEGAMHRMQTGGARLVSFGMGVLPSSVCMVELIRENLASRSPLKLHGQVLGGGMLREMLVEGEIEFAVTVEASMPPSTYLRQRRIGAIRVDLRVRRGHPLLERAGAGPTKLGPADLLDFPQIGGTMAKELSRDFLPGSVMYDPQVLCDSIETNARIVAATDAYAVFPRGFASPELVSLPDLHRPGADLLNVVLVEHQSRPLSAAAAEVAERIAGLLATTGQ